MKLTTFIAVAFIFCITLPNEIKAKGKKPKPAKFCIGENGKRYAKGKGYEDKEACKSYTCVKQGKKLKMKETKIPCSGSVDGAWSEWSNFGACSATCGTAAKTRTRSCTNPPPSNGGKTCHGLKEQTVACNLSQCGEPTPGGGDVTESIQFLNASMESMERKIDDLEASLESLMEKMAAMQSTSENYESCLADVCSATQGSHSEYNLIVTGGRNEFEMSLATSEIISPGGVCSQVIPPVPVAITNPELAYFNNSLYACGGYTVTTKEVMNKCYQLRDANSQWTEGPAMNRNRAGLTLTSVGEDLYALGGYDNGEDEYEFHDSIITIEKLSISSGKWTLMDQKLLPPRSGGYCRVFMEKTKSLIIIGGAFGNVYENVGLVEEFSLFTGKFTQLSTMPVPGRLIRPSCAVLDEAVVVAGGWINAKEHAGGIEKGGAQKEVYTFSDGQWKITGELKTPRFGHVFGILDNKLLAIGGAEFTPNGYLDSIEEIQRNGSSKIMPWKLEEKKELYGIARVPRELFPCV